MFRNLLTLGALAAAALATSCRQNHSDPQPIEAVVPLAVGNQWVYQVSRYDASGAPTDTVRLIRSVVKDTVINKSTWYVLNNRDIVRNTSQGYARYDGSVREQSLTIYQNSSAGGIGYGFDLPTYKVLVYTVPDSRLQSVVTPKGTFSSHQYTIENQYTYPGNAAVQIVKRLEYVAPGVGLVKSDQYYRDSPVLQQRQVLIDYTLK